MVVGYSVAIDACQKSFLWSKALSILNLMPAREIQPDVYGFSIMIKSYAVNGRWQQAATLMDSMLKRNILPNQVTYASFIASLQKGDLWQLALDILHGMRIQQLLPDNFCCSAVVSTCTRATRWQVGLEALRTMLKDQFCLNLVSLNSAISACSQGSLWQQACALSLRMRGRRVAPDLITYNSLLDALAERGQWESGLQLFRSLRSVSFLPNAISFSSTVSAFKSCGDWQSALAMHTCMRHCTPQQNEVAFGAGISSCERTTHWLRAIDLFRAMLVAGVQTNVISTNSVISACEVSGNLMSGTELLINSELMGQTRQPSAFIWALARLDVKDPVVIHSALLEAIWDLRKSDHQKRQQIASMWWAGQMLGATSGLYTNLLTQRSLVQLPYFTSEELLMLLWGGADHAGPELFLRAQQEWVTRIRAMLPASRFSTDSWQAMRSHAIGSLWASTYAGMRSQAFLLAATEIMLVAGSALDERSRVPVRGALTSNQTGRSGLGPRQQVPGPKDEPHICLDENDLLVILKPPGWTVEPDGSIGDQASQRSLQSMLAGRLPAPIFRDAAATFGFLHRLDVPSSGLVIASRSYRAYYFLLTKLASGGIVREYNVLTHGWVQRHQAELNARVYWRGGSPSRTGGQGKPSRSYLEVALLGVLGYRKYADSAITLVQMEIATGRRHQIRCHLAHVGHPVCRDDAYASEGTCSSDRNWCPRNALHRYRLRFQDEQGCVHDVVSPLPLDLREVLRELTPKTKQEAAAKPWYLQYGCGLVC